MYNILIIYHKMFQQPKLVLVKEKPILNTNIGVSVKSHWRNLPPLLHELKRNECSIHKAKYWNECTSMYIKAPKEYTYKSMVDSAEALNDPLGVWYQQTSYLSSSQGLPHNTCIYIYNIQTAPYTVMDFGCCDKTGLLCEILEVLSKYEIDIKGAYINTIGSVVSNIFFITHNEKQLSETYIEYLRNNLEAEVRTNDNDSY